MKILIFGKGYLGSRCKEAWGDDAVLSDKHILTVEDAQAEIQAHKPDAVLNAAGIVGKPNVDWCETHVAETAFGNTILPIYIAEACARENVYLLHMGTGCIYYGDSTHADKIWRENDFANPEAVYTRTKYGADLVLSRFPNVGIARIRMPIDNKPTPANLIDKLASYKKIVDVTNSVTIVEDMISAFYQLLSKKGTGIFHVVNSGAMKHRELIALYEQYVDPGHTNEWITEQDLVVQGLATKKRSNNILDSSNLNALGIYMRDVHVALEATMKQYGEIKNAKV